MVKPAAMNLLAAIPSRDAHVTERAILAAAEPRVPAVLAARPGRRRAPAASRPVSRRRNIAKYIYLSTSVYYAPRLARGLLRGVSPEILSCAIDMNPYSGIITDASANARPAVL